MNAETKAWLDVMGRRQAEEQRDDQRRRTRDFSRARAQAAGIIAGGPCARPLTQQPFAKLRLAGKRRGR